jgi:cytochrome c oxidase subunit 1
MVALLLGGIPGIFQALERIGVNAYASAPVNQALDESAGYYQGLTLHGVLLVIVYTFTFSNGFITLATMRAYGRPMASTLLTQLAFFLALAGTAMAGWAMLTNQATVLFTFYPPLSAHWTFYIGAVLLVVSTWVTLINIVITHRRWAADNPGERAPLIGFMAIMTYSMWSMASVGIAAEILFLILPWNFGWTDGIDAQLARTLFWLTGHPIVYFWLLPAYISWYSMIPKQAGGKLFSDPLARFVFILFLLFSAPVGFHHQYTESGIPQWMKNIHGIATFAIFFPSMITAFSVVSALESGGRARGGKGLFGWIRKLPWGNPSFTAQVNAMLIFTLGGASGLINASQTVNLVVHNTAFIVGHFHMTIGAVALAYIGIAYWLVPYLTGHRLFAPKLALAQSWLWLIGMLIFARGQISAGLQGVPRRTAFADSVYKDFIDGLDVPNWLTAIGGSMMGVSGLLIFIVIFGTIIGLAGRDRDIEPPVAETRIGATKRIWPWLDNYKLWVGLAILLVVLAYIPFIITYLPYNGTAVGAPFDLY